MKHMSIGATATLLFVSSRTWAFVPTISNTRLRANRQLSTPPHTSLRMADPTYVLRKTAFGIHDKENLKDVSSKDGVIFVDVRSPDEIEKAQCCRPFVHGQYLLEDCKPCTVENDLPNKDAHTIVFCAKGGRASKACQKLEQLGYSNVYNAGGLGDLDFLE